MSDKSESLAIAAELVGLDADDLPVHGFTVVSFLEVDGRMYRKARAHGEPLQEQTVGLLVMSMLDLVIQDKFDELLEENGEDE